MTSCIKPLYRIILVASALFSFSANGSTIGHSLRDLTKSADVIVFGSARQISIRPIFELSGKKVIRMAVDVKVCFKKVFGPIRQPGNTVSFMYATGGADDPTIKPGEDYIFFLRESEIGPHLFDGSVGVLPVTKGSVQTYFLIDEPNYQEFPVIKSRLFEYANHFGCDDS